MIALNKPLQPDMNKLVKYLKKINDNGWYTNFGPLHQELTERLEDYLGVKNLLLVSNGTLALQVACKALKMSHVITTPFSFVATSSSLLWQGIETSFSDINGETYNLCPSKLNEALKEDTLINGVVATHVYGNPCDVHAINKVSLNHDVKVIYDAAHAFGVNIDGGSVLKFGDASTLSFHATKVFHTVEGGAIVFKNKSDYKNAKNLINFGIQDDGSLGEPGINAKLNEYQCAVGLVLLDEIDIVIAHRKKLFEAYRLGLKNVVIMPSWHHSATVNGAYMPIYLSSTDSQDKVINTLLDNKVQCRRYFTPSLDLAYSQQRNFGCSESHRISDGVICLPLHNYMTEKQVSYVCQLVRTALM